MHTEEALCLRDGTNTLIISSGLEGCFHFPHRCVVCNAASRHRVRQTLRTRSLVALTPVLAATSGYDIEIEFSLCDEHRRQRYLRSALAVGGVFVALAAAVFFATPVAVIACLALVVALAVFAFVQFRTVRLLELDAVQARIRVGPAFAGSFAEDLG